MVRLKNSKAIILIIIVMALVSIITFSTINSVNAVKENNIISTSSTANLANELSEEQILDQYLKSDSLINESDYTINDYSDRLYSKKSAVIKKDEGFGLRLDNDDSIVNIVPKQFFFIVGNTLKIGDEYGFFISTESFSGNFISTVLVFDISTNTDLVETIDRAIVEVKPIFQYKYACLTTVTNTINMHGFVMNYNRLSEKRVVAFPSKMVNTSVSHVLEYEMSETYYLKDISMAATLNNEQELNIGDDGYDPYNDYGSYFTGYDYEYKGKYREYGSFPGEDLAWNILDTVSFVLGFIPGYSYIADIYSGYSLINSWFNFGQEVYNNKAGTVESSEKKITATCFYQNRDDQLRNYRDDNGNPYLIKTAALACNTDSDKSMWYGVGDYVRTYFNIGHSALGERNPYYTRFTNNLGIKVVGSDGDNIVAISNAVINDNMREVVEYDLKLEKEEQVYLLPNGYTKFKFEAEYASKYKISLNNNEYLSIMINDYTYSGRNLSIDYSLNENGRFNIILYGSENINDCNIKIEPCNNNSNIAISGKETYLLKLNNIDGVKNFTTDNNNIKITDIKILNQNYDLISYNSYGNIYSDKISYPFTDDYKSYYILLTNTTIAQLDNLTLRINQIESLRMGNLITTELYDGLTYFKFDTTTGGNYVFSLNNINGDNFEYDLLDSDYNKLIGYSYQKGTFIVSLNANRSYYLAASTGIHTSADIIINIEENAYQWEIQGIEGSQYYQTPYRTYERSLNVLIGDKYKLNFIINGTINRTEIYSVDDLGNYFKGYGISVNYNNELYVKSDTPLYGSGITVFATYNSEASYNHFIRLIPVIEENFNIESYNDEDMGLSFEATKYVYSYTYEMNGRIYENTFTDFNSDNFIRCSILKDYNNLSQPNVVQDINITFKKFTVRTASGTLKEFTQNKNLVLNNYFKNGDGTSNNPYVINSYRHLNNIRKLINNEKYFILEDDIFLAGENNVHSWNITWIPIERFIGNFNGNGHKIVMANLVTNSSNETYYGFIKENVGAILNLTISKSGMRTASTTSAFYGGIFAGRNSGRIENCIYRAEGVVSAIGGQGNFGWIVGRNSGRITNCKAYISSGSYQIAGKNTGIMQSNEILK